MSVPVLFSTGSLYNFGVERVFAWISEVGYDGVEVMMDGRWDTHEEEYLRAISLQHDAPIRVLHPPIYEGAWRLSADETLVRAARLANSLDVPTVVAHPPRTGQRLREWRSGTLVRARDEGAVIAVENMPKSGRRRSGLPGFPSVAEPPQTVHLPEHLDGFEEITLDTSHVAASNLDLLEFYEEVAPRIRHVHLSDSDLSGGDQHRLPGKGKLPLMEFLGRLSRDGYSGTVSLELKPFQVGAPHPEKILQRMEEALDFTRNGLG